MVADPSVLTCAGCGRRIGLYERVVCEREGAAVTTSALNLDPRRRRDLRLTHVECMLRAAEPPARRALSPPPAGAGSGQS